MLHIYEKTEDKFEHFRSFEFEDFIRSKNYFMMSVGMIIIFDVTSEESFITIEKMLKNKRNLLSKKENFAKIYLIGDVKKCKSMKRAV